MSIDILQHAAAWVAGLRHGDITLAARQTARDCVVDTFGVALAGRHSPVWRQCAGAVDLRAGAPASVWGGQGAGMDSASAPEAAFTNAVAAHAWDFDDTSYAGIVHGSAVVLPAAWAACELAGGHGEDLLTAFVAGVETEYGLGLATGNVPYERGYWATATLGIVGAAAASARALRLDAADTAHAIGLALAMPIGLRAVHGSTAKPYLCGLAARLGLEAALAAQAGLRCTPHVLAHRFGFAALVGGGQCESGPFERLGESFAVVSPGVARKRHPLCSATQAAIEAVCDIRQGQEGFADSIRSIECEGTRLVVDSLPYRAPLDAQQAQFSMQFALACAARYGDVSLQHLDASVIGEPQLRELMERVVLVPAGAPFEDEAAHPEAARVRITFTDGTMQLRTVLAASGMPQRPMGGADLAGKFLACAAFAGVASAKAMHLHDWLARIDHERRPLREALPAVGH